jgi:hypothetical protein
MPTSTEPELAGRVHVVTPERSACSPFPPRRVRRASPAGSRLICNQITPPTVAMIAAGLDIPMERVVVTGHGTGRLGAGDAVVGLQHLRNRGEIDAPIIVGASTAYAFGTGLLVPPDSTAHRTDPPGPAALSPRLDGSAKPWTSPDQLQGRPVPKRTGGRGCASPARTPHCLADDYPADERLATAVGPRCSKCLGLVSSHGPAQNSLGCRRGDLNPHALAGTRPSTWRVCLFRHSDVATAGMVVGRTPYPTQFAASLVQRHPRHVEGAVDVQQ